MMTKVGTYRWMAPEVYNYAYFGLQTLSSFSTIWSNMISIYKVQLHVHKMFTNHCRCVKLYMHVVPTPLSNLRITPYLGLSLLRF